ncbi:MAG: hypothetical protein DMD33_02620 [Gemmatimonadetes bacterium]|nr:MAG: hypothetical protein DMD33_02620 [Gemmatimonadota bacterium]
MSDYLYSNLPVHVRHLPDQSVETDANGINHVVELPGFVEIGVEIEGHFRPLAKFKAAGLLADIERAKSGGKTDKSKG